MRVLDPLRDVDGFHPLNMGRNMLRGVRPTLLPCADLAAVELLKRNKIELKGKLAAILGD